MNSTISGNTANLGGAFWSVAFGTANFHNSIVAGSGDSMYRYIFGGNSATVTGQNSVFSDVGNTGITAAGNNQLGIDWTTVVENDGTAPTLANNGGLTQTIALIDGSSAIDAGNNALAVDATGTGLTTDQAGQDRFVGGVTDIGAYEWQGAANEAPVLVSLSSSNGDLSSKSMDGLVTIGGSFTDEASDSHVVTVDWGDGSTGSLASVDQVNDLFDGSHQYNDGGFFDITVTVTDSFGESSSATTTAVVAGVGVMDDTLVIVGSASADELHVHQNSSGDIDVHTQLGDGDWETASWAAGSFSNIAIYACDGDDYVHVDRDLTLPATVFGHGGDDTIRTGGGDDFVDGGQGNDLLKSYDGNDTITDMDGDNVVKAGRGDDVVTLGAGNDWGDGWKGDDLIVTGDGNNTVWGGAGDDTIIAGNGHDVLLGGRGNDIMSGGGGHDWMFGGRGNDLMIGGTGCDVMLGGSGGDLLVADATANEGDLPSLDAAMSDWQAGDLSAALSDLGAIADDGEDDFLWGGWGNDELVG